MHRHQGKDLFQLQTELVQMKVDMAVNNTIDRVLNGIADLKGEMVHLEKTMEHRLIAVETKLGMVNETEKEMRARFYEKEKHVRNNFIDYSFKAGWLLLATVLTYLVYHFQGFIK